jgi:hypothetical protein
LPIQQHSNGKSAHPTPGSLFGRGLPRAVYEGFAKFDNAAEKKNLLKMVFLVLLID